MKCFYHSDADGLFSAFHVLAHWKKTHPSYEYNQYDFMKVDHTSNLTRRISELIKGETVFIVDFSFPVDKMKELLQVTDKVIWIDHHQSDIDEYGDFESQIAGIRYSGVAASMLSWLYFNTMVINAGDYTNINQLDLSKISEAPLSTRLVANRDTWDFEPGDLTDLFTVAFAATNVTGPGDQLMYDLQDSNLVKAMVAKDGVPMLKYKESINARLCNSRGFPCMFHGYRCYALNVTMTGSDVFDDLIAKDKYEMLITFHYDGDQWSYTIYPNRDNICAYKIAMQYNGGGHDGVAKFRTDNLILQKGA